MKDLSKITHEEWENICDNCGKCCLIKLQDEDTNENYYTNIICRYYDLENQRCSVYENRDKMREGCLILTKENVDKLEWMPKTCAYRKLFEKDFKLCKNCKPLKGRVISEADVNEDDWEDYIIDEDEL